jgi:hypothetical protein
MIGNLCTYSATIAMQRTTLRHRHRPAVPFLMKILLYGETAESQLRQSRKLLWKALACFHSCVTLGLRITLRKEFCMSLHSHLTELERRHEALDREIEKEWGHPAADEMRLAELKRRKLQLKDEIAKLKTDTPSEVVH